MKKKYEYLEDNNFLKIMDEEHLKEQYAKITVLDWQERPIQEIQGIVIGGNLNLDGKSSMRRSLNLSLYIDREEKSRITDVDNIISINKKFYLEIGYKNTTNLYTNYDIIWYPQGVFVMINPTISHGIKDLTIQLSAKDKMCLLNGECGGVISASTQFDNYETIDEYGNRLLTYPVIQQIIRELVNHFGGEQLGKIIISDIDTRIKKVMKWIGSSPLYLIKINTDYIFSTNYEDTIGNEYKTYEYGDDVGYIYTDFIYTQDLIGDIGSSVCTILDNIVNFLGGNFEYFYDVDGNFIFQEIKNYLNTSKSTIDLRTMNEKDYLIDISNGKTVYNFDNSNLISSYSNTPQFNSIKNDFLIWGKRKDANGVEYPIRYHLAIDSKPKIGNIYDCFFYIDPEDGLTKAKLPIKYSSINNFPKIGVIDVFYMDTSTNFIYKWDAETQEYVLINISLSKIKTTDWRTELYLQGVQADPFGIESNYYYTELINEWPKIYNLKKNSVIIDNETVYLGGFYDEVLRTPSDIDFYLDCIDSSTEISKFNVSNIGRRTQTIVDNDINCIFEPEIPNYVLIETGKPDTAEKRQECENKGQQYIQVDSGIFSMITGGGNFNSAYEKIRSMLNQYTSYNETVNLQTIPIYHLEPNTRIGIRDLKSNILGDYMISTISLPLGIESTMNITATKAIEKL